MAFEEHVEQARLDAGVYPNAIVTNAELKLIVFDGGPEHHAGSLGVLHETVDERILHQVGDDYVNQVGIREENKIGRTVDREFDTLLVDEIRETVLYILHETEQRDG